MPNTVLVDTGFLVALFDAGDPLHDTAKDLLAEILRPERYRMVTVWSTVVETCFFLNLRGKNLQHPDSFQTLDGETFRSSAP